MKKGLLKAYRLAFGFTNMKDKQEIFKVMEEISPDAKQLILDDMETWDIQRDPMGLRTRNNDK